MIPLLALLGLAAVAAGIVVLRSLGPRLRVGRLLASVPEVTVAEARAMAERGDGRYLRVAGRVDSEEDFEDDQHRPLVFRRTRFEARRGSRWVAFEDRREAVAFEVRDGLDGLAVEADELDTGLVVIPAESTGSAADLGDRAPGDLAPATPVRLRIEQVSSVEHAIVLGVPGRLADGRLGIRAGLGRPLVLTTLEPPEAMRVLGGGDRPRLATALVLVGAALLVVAALVAVVAPGAAFAASPLAASPSAGPAPGGDPRSPGEGPGLVGDPLLAVLGVAAVALLSIVATLAWLRLTSPPADRGTRGPGRS